VLLVVLWIKSYSAGTVFYKQLNSTQSFKIVSQRGFLGAVLSDPRDAPLRSNVPGLVGYGLASFGEPSWDIRIRPKPDIYAQGSIHTASFTFDAANPIPAP
jgi:hypothetical protein